MHTSALESRPSSFVSRYGIAMLAVVTATVLTVVLRELEYPGVFALFYAAVLLGAWFGGLGPALVNTVLSSVVTILILHPSFNLVTMTPATVAQLGVFLLVALLTGWLGTLHNQSIHARRASEQHYRELFERNIAGVFLTDIGGRILDCNESFARILGHVSREEVLKRQASDFYFDVAQRDEVIKRLQSEKTVHLFESCVRGKDDKPVWILENLSLLKDSTGARTLLQGTIIDITEHKHEEDEQRKQKELLQAVFDHAPVMMSFYSEDGPIKMVNREWERTRGWSMEEIKDQNLDVLAIKYPDPLDQQRVRNFINEASGEWAEFKTRSRSGQVLDTTWAVVSLSDGTRVCIGKDITESKRAEEELKKREAQLNDAQHLAQMGSWEWDIPTDAVTGSDELHRIWGLERKNFRGTYEGVLQCILPDDREAFDHVLQTCYREGRAFTCEHRIVRADGEIRRIQVRGQVVQNEAGNPIRMFGTSQDISERGLAEAALRRSEEKYRELFENAQDAIYVHDLKGRYISVNRAAEELSGYSRDEIIGKSFSRFVAPKYLNELRAKISEKLTHGTDSDYEIEFIAKDGRRVPVEVSSRLIYENGVPIGVQGMARDISNRKRAEEALRNLPRRLIGAQEAERRRVARELHDGIGQALTAIKINLQDIQRSTLDSVLVQRLNENAAIVDNALQQVRELSLDLRPSLLDDLGLTAALRWYVERESKRMRLVLELNIDVSEVRLAPEVETACFRIAQEALTNIARHSHAKRVRVELTLRESDLNLAISDDGVGFDVGRVRRRFASDSSLGLQGMQERALAVGGRIEIEAAKGYGTRIQVQLPFIPYTQSIEDY